MTFTKEEAVVLQTMFSQYYGIKLWDKEIDPRILALQSKLFKLVEESE